MKKILGIVIISSLLVVNSSEVILATEATGSSRSGASPGAKMEQVKAKIEEKTLVQQEHRETIRNRIEEFKEKIASQQAQLKQKLEEKVRNRVQKMFETMIRRSRAAVERLRSIMDRIQTRLEKLAGKGVKTDEMEKTLKQARTSLTEAEEMLNAAEAEFPDQVLNSETFQAGFAAIKETVGDFKVKIKEVNGLMRDVV